MFDAILQILIAVLGLAALLLVTYGRASGYVVGLITTPLWILFAVRARAWGVLVLACAYGIVWILGIVRHILHPLDLALDDEARYTFADSVGAHPDDVDCDEAGTWYVRRGARPPFSECREPAYRMGGCRVAQREESK
jgi:hypothetical protein